MQTQSWLAMTSDSVFSPRHQVWLLCFPTGYAQHMSACAVGTLRPWTSLAKHLGQQEVQVHQCVVPEIRLALFPVSGILGLGTEMAETSCSHPLLFLSHRPSPHALLRWLFNFSWSVALIGGLDQSPRAALTMDHNTSGLTEMCCLTVLEAESMRSSCQ